jgi:hypothetical protein
LLGDTDEHVVRRAELLELHFAQPKCAERGAHFREIGSAGFGLHLHQRAALEVDAEIERNADSGKLMRRKRMKSNLVSSGTMRSKRTAQFPQIGTRCGRRQRTQ